MHIRGQHIQCKAVCLSTVDNTQNYVASDTQYVQHVYALDLLQRRFTQYMF